MLQTLLSGLPILSTVRSQARADELSGRSDTMRWRGISSQSLTFCQFYTLQTSSGSVSVADYFPWNSHLEKIWSNFKGTDICKWDTKYGLLGLRFTKDAVCKFVYINMYKIHDCMRLCVCVWVNICVCIHLSICRFRHRHMLSFLRGKYLPKEFFVFSSFL